MLLHGARVMESVKPILDSETRTEDVKEQVNTSNRARVLEFNILCNLSHTVVYVVVLKSGSIGESGFEKGLIKR